MNFGRSEQEHYRKYIVPIYGDFLRKCYSEFLICLEYFLPDLTGACSTG